MGDTEQIKQSSPEDIIYDIKQKFVDWTKKKIRHHFCKDTDEDSENIIFFREGQIWWVAFGQNVGLETDGKHEEFHRPALILKKYNKDMCFVVPLTTQIKDYQVWYQIPVSGSDKLRVANITQGRTISSKRLLKKEGSLGPDEFKNILEKFREQFL